MYAPRLLSKFRFVAVCPVHGVLRLPKQVMIVAIAGTVSDSLCVMIAGVKTALISLKHAYAYAEFYSVAPATRLQRCQRRQPREALLRLAQALATYFSGPIPAAQSTVHLVNALLIFVLCFFGVRRDNSRIMEK